MATIPTTNALAHFSLQDPLKLPGVTVPLAQSQLNAVSEGMWLNARRYMREDMARATGSSIQATVQDLKWATTFAHYRPDYTWRRIGVSTGLSAKGGLQSLLTAHRISKYTIADAQEAAKTSALSVARVMTGYLIPSMAQEDTYRRESMQRAVALLTNDAEVFYGFRGLADHIPSQALSDLASGASSYYSQQLHQLEMYRIWKDYNDFSGKSEFAGYFSGGLSNLLGVAKDALPPTGGDAIGL